MVSLFRILLRTLAGHPPKLICRPLVWNEGVNELKQRAGGKRESGAFLLGRTRGPVRVIEQFLFYEDVDPSCFAHGIVEFDGTRLGRVWEICRKSKMMVVADVHVHPGHFGQSPSDRNNPMIAQAGHLAVVVPDYATRCHLPGRIGVYEYLGARRWRDHSVSGAKTFYVGWWP
jgi:hypothetical protein